MELTAGGQQLTGGFQDGGSIGIRLRHERPRDVWYAGLSRESRFGDTGTIASLANTHVINADWYTYAGVAVGSDAVFLPRRRLDVQAARKFGARREWVGTLSVAASAAQDEHRDLGAGVGLMRYFTGGWVADGSVFWNRSNPGAVIARRQNLALTYLRPQRYQGSARLGFGREAYQLVGAGAALVDFSSTEFSVRWQHWLTRDAGVSLGSNYYSNPHYSLSGLTVSLFKQFGS